MQYLLFAVLTPLNLLFTLVAVILAPMLALLCNGDGWLPAWLGWFQTPDNSCDAGWKVQGNFGTYLTNGAVPVGFTLWWYRVRWLWRNAAYGFCYYPLGIAFDPTQWVIDVYQTDAQGNLILLRAHSTNGRWFAYKTGSGWELGWKLWAYFRGLDPSGNPIWSPTPWGPVMRTSICFTPANPLKS